MSGYLWGKRFGLATALLMGLATHGGAQALFDGCPSAPIRDRFADFGRTGKMPQDLGRWLNDPDGQKIDPWSPFDTVDFVGLCWVSAWLIHTTAGSVLIDTLYGPFQQTLLGNIRKTGTDLADIKYVLVTHGHFDHAGGAAGLKAHLPNATFVMTQKGWDEAAISAKASRGGATGWDMIAPERVVADGDILTLGDTRFTVLETPGHTWGTASYLYDVRDGTVRHRAITIGGLGLNAIDGPAQVEAFLASLDRVEALAKSAGVDVHLSTHGFSNNLDEDRRLLAARAPGAPNPLVNPAGLLAQIATLRAGAQARLLIERGN